MTELQNKMAAPLDDSRSKAGGVLWTLHLRLSKVLEKVERELLALPTRAPREGGFDITALINRVRSRFPDSAPAELSRGILLATHDLLAFANRRPQYLNGPHDAGVASLSDSDLMESLSGAWLGLYFLGIPFAHPWERVARHAIRHGFTRGAGIRKVGGDVYRKARLDISAMRASSEALPRVHVLDHNPLALNRLLQRERTREVTIAALGACYEFLQLRLYLREGGSINYYMFDSAIYECLCGAAGFEHNANELWSALNIAFGVDIASTRQIDCNQRVVVIRPDQNLERMPACVFSDRDGVYRSRLKTGTQFDSNGSRLAASQINIYRGLLEGASAIVVPASPSKSEFASFCANFIQMQKQGSQGSASSLVPPSAEADVGETG